MKKIYFNLFCFILIISMIACNKNSVSKQASIDKNNNNSIQTEEYKNKVSDKTNNSEIHSQADEKTLPHQQINKDNLKLVIGSKKASEVLKKLGYENPVGVPDTCQKDWPDATVFGSEDNPNYEILKDLHPTVYITESNLTYKNSKPNEKLHSCGVYYYNFKDDCESEEYLAQLKDISYLIYNKDKAEEVINNLALNESNNKK